MRHSPCSERAWRVGRILLLLGVAFLIVSQVYAHRSTGRIVLFVLIRVTEGQMHAILWYCKRCISSLGIRVTPLENTYDLHIEAYRVGYVY